MILWLLRALTTWLPMRRIPRDGKPYNDRFFLLGKDGKQRAWGFLARSPVNVFIHHFLNSDTYELLHNHPYRWSWSWILFGGYMEERMREDVPGLFSGLESRELNAGRFNWIGRKDWHRVELTPGRDCWTLFVSSARKPQKWHFIDRYSLETELASGKT